MEQQSANLLDAGREALARGDWEEARACFEAALNLEELPWEDNAFDLATGFNSVQYAANPVNALAGLLSDGTAVQAIRTSGEERVREAVINALAPFKTASGGYWLENKFRYLIATV